MNKIFKCLLVAGIVAVSGYGISKSINKDTAELDALTLVNIEALALNESGSGKGTLYGDATGTRYCCCPGSNDCAASNCSFNCP